MQIDDIVPGLVLSAPVWIVLMMGVSVVCIDGTKRIRSGQAPGWRTPLLSWLVCTLLLWLPLSVFALAGRRGWGLALAGAYALIAAIPFASAGAILNRRSNGTSPGRRGWGALAMGIAGVALSLVLSYLLGESLGFERYP
jgi:hypothetical protein